MNSVEYNGQLWRVGDLVKTKWPPPHHGHIVDITPREELNTAIADVIWQNGEKLSFSFNYLELIYV
jgi:hypothetical protein